MFCNKYSIKVESVNKKFLMFSNPIERLKQIIGIDKKYNEYEALQEISFNVLKGETVGIIGVNGSGKSTLLQIICGTLQPTSGRVFVDGRISALLELGAGFNPEFSGAENIVLNATLMGLSKKEIDAIYNKVIEFADIGDFIHQPVKTYSSGMFARVAFSAAIHVEPDILIVDEILAVGDSRFQRKCLNKLKEIREKGCTILFVSHDDYQVRNICSKVLYLRKGKQIFFGDANDGVNYYLQDQQEREAKEIITKQERAEQYIDNTGKLVELNSPRLLNEDMEDIDTIESGDCVYLEFNYKCNDIETIKKLTFVFNLYRKDGVYVCGTTTQMQGLDSYIAHKEGKVKVKFPSFDVLAGIYNWRVAVNDSDGIQIIDELIPVCEFNVRDSFKSVGVYNIKHDWIVEVI
ncbi:ATP-binding cassette domain-containing protein [Photobacterium carnosum]|uniref:ABC transporter ATP-binding protein n=1 Tax=Photobacterium carnosum TaxID=2023717 RepID=UPI001F1A7E8B|nr:ABC transporter ATP-binding protein [Photobacterium carnosum]MCF2155746.1 ATP-binding cassette domain-containing protein [Photobacterium carnosum]MCF2217573.1 ATP-binding cassette domain-containing protein [Photobacterium carnosum]